VAALATVCGGQAWLAVDLLLLGCVPLAGLTAYLATRWVVSAAPARMLLAAAYALAPLATGAVAAGRLGTAVAFILLPLTAVSAGRMLTAAPRQARRAAWAAGLLIAAAAAFVPLAWVLGLALALTALAARRWLVAVDPVNAVIVVVTPFLVLFPWSLHLLSSPSAFLTEAGLSSAALTTPGLPASELFALSPGGPGLPPQWVTAGFVLALVALLLPSRLRPGRRTGLAVAGWAAVVAGLLAAVIVSRISVTPAGGAPPAAGWPGLALALAALGLLLASAPAVEGLVRVIQNGSADLSPPLSLEAGSPAAGSPTPWSTAAGKNGRRRLLAGTALAAVASVPLLVAGYWVTGGVRGPVGSVPAQVLPAFVAASAASGQQYRTLVLRTDAAGQLSYAVVRQSDPTLGEPELAAAPAAGTALNQVVAALGSADEADAGDPGQVLGTFGVKYVLLPSPVDSVLAQRLDAAIGLEALSKAPTYDLWQVSSTVARASVVAADGTVTALTSGPVDLSGVTAPVSGGTLILAEPHGGWTARLNGHDLQSAAKPADGWAQAFVLPRGGGTLSVTRDNLARHLSLLAELIALLAVCLLALPGKRTDPVQEAQALAALRETRDSRRAGRAARRTASPAVGAASPADGDVQLPVVAGNPVAGHPAVSDRPAVTPDRPGRGPGHVEETTVTEDKPFATVDAGLPPASAAAAADPWPAVAAVEAWLAAVDVAPPVLAAPPAEPAPAAEPAEPWNQGSHAQEASARELKSPWSDPLAAESRAPESREPQASDPWGSAAWDLTPQGVGAWAAGPQGNDPQNSAAQSPEIQLPGVQLSEAPLPEAPLPEAPLPETPLSETQGTGAWNSGSPGTGGWNYDALSTESRASESRASEPAGDAEPWTAEREDVDAWLSGLRGGDADSEPLGTESRQPEPQGVSEWRVGPSGTGEWHPESSDEGERQPQPSGTGGSRSAETPAASAQFAETPPARPRFADPVDAGAWSAERSASGAWDMAGDWGRAARTGEQPAAPTGEQPAARTGEQPAARTGEQPTARTGEQPRYPWASGPQPVVSPVAEQPAAPAGVQPRYSWDSGPQAAVPRTGEQPAAVTGEQPASRAPWESDPWGSPTDTAPAPERPVAPPQRRVDLPEQAEAPAGSGAYPAAAQPATPERHSHRAKHSKPSRWRGNRSGGDGSD
jgi:hypothetical protein